MFRILKTIQILAACAMMLICLIGCEQKLQPASAECVTGYRNCVLISGKLTQAHVDAVRAAAGKIDIVVIDSSGGRSGYGVEIGKLLHQNKLPLLVVRQCSSACAEYILPGADYVLVVGRPVFSFHGNAMIDRDIGIERGFQIEDRCKWANLEWMEYIYETKKLSYEFVEMQKKVTGPPAIEFGVRSDGCIKYTAYSVPVKSWEPDIATMRDIWGLDIRNYKG